MNQSTLNRPGPTFVTPDHRQPAEPWPQTMLLRIMQLNALVAGICSAYLAWASLSRGNVVGCGDGGWDCVSVLGSSYSTWFGIPVGAPATALYATIFLVLFFCPQSVPQRVRQVAWRVVVILSLIAGGAGLWFVGVQAFALMKFCLWCTAVHTCGVVLGATALTAMGSPWKTKPSSILAAFLGLGLLVAGQYFQPEHKTYVVERVEPAGDDTVPLVSDEPVASNPDDGESPGETLPNDDLIPDVIGGNTPSAPLMVVDRGAPKTISVVGNRAKLRTDQFPLLGTSEADRIVVKLFDYTCPHCRHLHHHLEALHQSNPRRFAVLLVPVPLNSTCNKYIEETNLIASDACVLARLALCVWMLDRKAFYDFDRWLFAVEYPRLASEARAKAIELVGEERLDEAWANPIVGKQLKFGAEIYRMCEFGSIPKLLDNDHIFSGRVETPAELKEVMANEFRIYLQPASSTAP